MSIAVQEAFFDDKVTLIMGEAFDRASTALDGSAMSAAARDIVAKRIICAAVNGERDRERLCEAALVPVGQENMPIPIVCVGHETPIMTYASITHTAWPASIPPYAIAPQRLGAGRSY